MKVSITFDKDIKQNNKKQWVREIQDVVNKLNSKSKTEVCPNSPKHSPETSFRKQNQQVKRIQPGTTNDVNIIGELIQMQKIMQDKFSILTKSICKLSDKLNNVQKRVCVLQKKQQIRQVNQQDFDEQFAQISLKYDRLRRQSVSSEISSQSTKKYMAQTNDTGFSFQKIPQRKQF